MHEIQIATHTVGLGHKPFVVAEMSGNHNQSLDRAFAIVDAAARAGAHALKIQTYTPDTMTIDAGANDFHIREDASLWKGRSLYELYREAMTPWEWHEPIFRRCRERGLVGFSSPFDATAVDFLERLDVPCYKVASFENTDVHLIERIAATGKPVIVSTGMATVAELDETVRTLRRKGNDQIILLKCTSSYPASPVHTNLATIPHMRELFGCPVGLSDHTFGIGAAVASVALGACMIEKHFTLARADGGVDAAFSLEEPELTALVIETERAHQAWGHVHYGPTAGDSKSVQFRRSLYVTADVRRGEVFGPHNVRAIRPGFGLPVKYLDVFCGKRAGRDVARGTPVSWELLDEVAHAR